MLLADSPSDNLTAQSTIMCETGGWMDGELGVRETRSDARALEGRMLASGPRTTLPLGDRAFDLLAVTLVGPILLIPAAIVAVLVFLDSPGSVLHRAERLGLNGVPFTMLKFRTMRSGSSGPGVTTADDVRITPIGRFLRLSRLDELPQLWNVLRGEMRLVGPRPEDTAFVAAFSEEYRAILAVAPGLTGPTQLEFAAKEAEMLAGDASPAGRYLETVMPLKVASDLAYVRSRSAPRDVAIIARTLLLPLSVAATRLVGSVVGHRPLAPAYAVCGFSAFALLLIFVAVAGPSR